MYANQAARSYPDAMRTSRGPWAVPAFILMIVAGGCTRQPPAREPNPLEAPPVDTARVRSAEEAATWNYRRELVVDLDGDRQDERLVVAADAEVGARGHVLWEDGHRWAVFVDALRGRTLLYGAFVPNGFVEVAALIPGSDGRRKVLVQERTPSQLRALEVEYQGPGSARLSSAAYYQIGEWLPGSAAMPADAADLGLPITTDRTEYVLTPASPGRQATIVATFRAPRDRTVHIVHCNGAISWGLQRLEAGRWVDVWVAETNGCLSAPIVVRAGKSFVDTLTLVSRDDVPAGSGRVRHRIEPGIHRMIWYGVLTSFDRNAPAGRPPGPELPSEARVSGPITIRESR